MPQGMITPSAGNRAATGTATGTATGDSGGTGAGWHTVRQGGAGLGGEGGEVRQNGSNSKGFFSEPIDPRQVTELFKFLARH